MLAQVRRPNNKLYLLASALLDLQSNGKYEITGSDKLSRAARRLRRDGRPYFLVGIVLFDGDELCPAIEAFRESLRREKSFGPSRSLLGTAILAHTYRFNGVSQCSKARIRDDTAIDEALGMSRDAARDWGGASLYYHLADALLLAANIEVETDSRDEYIEEARSRLMTAQRLDKYQKRKARMTARWHMALSSSAAFDREIRHELAKTENEAWGLFDLAVYERCIMDNVSAVYDIWGLWIRMSSDRSGVAEGVAEAGMHWLRDNVSNKSLACESIMTQTAPLLWSASQALTAMGDRGLL